MKKYFLLIVIFLFYFTNIGWAAPSVTGTTGTWAHGDSVVISGSSFGTKSPAAPLWWDDGEGATTNDPTVMTSNLIHVTSSKTNKYYETADPSPSQDLTVGDIISFQYKTSWASVAQAHDNSTIYITGGHGDNADCGGGGCNIVSGSIYMEASKSVVYASYYYMLPDTWDDVTYGTGDNYKEAWINDCDGGDCGYKSVNVSYLSKAGTPWMYDASESGYLGWNSTGMCSPENPLEEAVHSALGKWVKRETFWHLSTSSDLVGLYSYCENPTTGAPHNETNRMGTSSSGCNMTFSARENFAFGSFARIEDSPVANKVHDGMKRFMDDLYLDDTLSRVVLTDSATFTSSSIMEMQIPSAWATGEITITVNQGAIPNGTAYLFVFDDANDVNGTGYGITLEGGSEGTCFVGGLQTIKSGSQTLTFE